MRRRRIGGVPMLALCMVLAVLALCAPVWAYTQDYLYEDSGSWCNVQLGQDHLNGKNYIMLYDTTGTNSLLYEVPVNFSGKKEELKGQKPFMTIPGRVSGIETRMSGFQIMVREDVRQAYVYYRLDGDKTNLYRMPLQENYSGQPEVRSFTVEGSTFLFTSFTPARELDEFLLVSKESDQREVTIGLFSFASWNSSGGNEPIRTWTCTLPEEREYKSLAHEVGYRIVYEESTETVWLVVRQSYFSNRGTSNYSKWFFYAPLDRGGRLQAFEPETEILEWNDDVNFKEMEIGRYRRTVSFSGETYPNRDFTAIAVYETETGGRVRLTGKVESWTDAGGTRRPLREFWAKGGSGNRFSSGNSVESHNAVYVLHSTEDSEGNENFVRVVRFVAERPIKEIGPDPTEDGKPQPADAVVLKAEPFQGPAGYAATGSRWEVYRKSVEPRSKALSIRSDEKPVYIGHNEDGASSHKLTQTLPAGDYEWRMIYYWRIGGEGGMKGSTYWSKPGSFTAVASSTPAPTPTPKPTPTPNPEGNKGGGGCSGAPWGVLALLLAFSFLSRRRGARFVDDVKGIKT